jgi:upstream activation factor subunit UAF30
MPKATEKKTVKKGGGLAAPVQPDKVLAELVGSKPLSRPEITKKLWAYIKKNNLQDTKNKRLINADDKLKPFFDGKKQVDMMQLAKHVSAHINK